MAGKSKSTPKRPGARVTRAEWRRLERAWRDAVRETIKQLPTPPDGRDILALFNVVLDEVTTGRALVVAVWPVAAVAP